jgi:hypothetical protein
VRLDLNCYLRSDHVRVARLEGLCNLAFQVCPQILNIINFCGAAYGSAVQLKNLLVWRECGRRQQKLAEFQLSPATRDFENVPAAVVFGDVDHKLNNN